MASTGDPLGFRTPDPPSGEPMKAEIRDATPADLPDILRITNDVIETSVATFDLKPFTLEEHQAWLDQFGEEHPLLVAEVKGTVRGFAYLLPYRLKPAYSRTKETSVYVEADSQRSGIGTALAEALIARARAAGVHALIAVLGGRNEASEALHRKLGFKMAGHLREVGYKFERWVDIYLYQKILSR
jgi:phosphinothricin acetyltransferase